MARTKKNYPEADEYVVRVSEVEKEKTAWLVPHWIPKGAITLLVGDGGIGKTNLWCYLLSCISACRSSIFDEDPEPEDAIRCMPEDMTCMYFSAEDSTSRRLKGQFEKYEANTDFLITVGMEHLRGFHYASESLERMIKKYEPSICVFDPMQAFMPKGSSMSSRQDSREALDHLVRLGEAYGTAFLLVCHTNKKRTDDWRQRISGSADLPDIARSVIFTDYTEIKAHHEIRFISNEKNSYHAPQETILYTMKDGVFSYAGMSVKKFADYAHDAPWEPVRPKEKTQKELCREATVAALTERGEITIKSLTDILTQAGFSVRTAEKTRDELVKENILTRRREPGKSGSDWFIMLTPQETEKNE